MFIKEIVMKKIIILAGLFMFAATSAFAGVSVPIGTFGDAGKTLHGVKSGTADANSPLIGKTSTGVALGLLTTATGTGYSAVTQHKNGTKCYGSSFDSTSIYSKDVATVGTAELSVPTATDSSNFTGTGWTSL